MLNQPARRLQAALLSGVLLALALPPLPLGFLAWFALVPLFASLEKASSRKEAFKLALLTALPYHLVGMYWIAFNTGAGWGARLGSSIGAIVILTLWVGGVGVLHRILLERWVKRGHLVAVALWVAQEVIRARGELGFPWVFLSLTQSYYLPVMQLTAVGGTALVTAWVAAVNALIVQRWRRHLKVAIVVALISLTYIGGYMRIALVRDAMEREPIGRIGLAQGNIPAAKKWKLGAKHSIDIYEMLSKELIEQDVDLIVWPETATPVRLQRSRIWRPYMQRMVDSLGVPLVTGASHHEFNDGIRERYNAAFMIRPGGKEQFDFYAKVHLVPFGERVPFQWVFPSLGKLNFGQAEFKPGPGTVAWPSKADNGTFRSSPMICYEAIFPDLGRDAVGMDANVLLNLTNDGWLDTTTEPEQHLLLSAVRAIESGRTLVRATNTGISAFVTPDGNIHNRLPLKIRGGAVMDIPSPVYTTYLRGGWLFGGVVSLLTLLLYAWFLAERLFRKDKTVS